MVPVEILLAVFIFIATVCSLIDERTGLAAVIFGLAELALFFHINHFHLTFWVTPGLFVLGIIVFCLKIQYEEELMQ